MYRFNQIIKTTTQNRNYIFDVPHECQTYIVVVSIVGFELIHSQRKVLEYKKHIFSNHLINLSFFNKKEKHQY